MDPNTTNNVSNTPASEPLQPSEPVIGRSGNRLSNITRRKAMLGVPVVIALAIIGVALFASHSIQTKDDQEMHKYEASIQLTDSGFVPSYATVKAHTFVSFENTGKTQVDQKEAQAEGLQPGSSGDAETADAYQGPNRQFTINPASPKKDKDLTAVIKLAPFGTFGHTFQNTGTYMFHDVNNPTSNLTIVVVADK